VYRDRFRPSAQLAAPYVMVGANLFAADTDEEAARLFTSLQQAFVNLRRGEPGPLPPPRENFDATLAPFERAMLNQMLACSLIGSPAAIATQLQALVARTKADEVILTSQIYDHQARLHAFELAQRLHK
jgi:alkanesulfonate monooxygenase SsuD/methylene tetrahydromethanopterin reductase-like flavin-dependent oxidoreductase (luciferase family)